MGRGCSYLGKDVIVPGQINIYLYFFLLVKSIKLPEMDLGSPHLFWGLVLGGTHLCCRVGVAGRGNKLLMGSCCRGMRKKKI